MPEGPSPFLRPVWLSLFSLLLGAADRWQLDPKVPSISWEAGKDRGAHQDRVEMSGARTAAILSYGRDAGGFLVLERTVVWPTLRVAPNDTHSSLMVTFGPHKPPLAVNAGQALEAWPATRFEPHFEPMLHVEGRPCPQEKLLRVRHGQGLLALESEPARGLVLKRELFPSAAGMGLLERWVLRNARSKAVKVAVPPFHVGTRLPYRYAEKGFMEPGKPLPPDRLREGTYLLDVDTAGLPERLLAPGKEVALAVAYTARREGDPAVLLHPDAERAARLALARSTRDSLRFECPDPELEALFAFSKLRACESIIETAHGPMHAPGGGSYYAAMWTNDTVEYVGPFYPFLGHAKGNEATLNALSHYARYMNPEFKPLPVSIIAEGTDTWTVRRRGADGTRVPADRGDAAMIAFGGSRFLLALGDKAEARRHWPLLKWCLEYTERRRGPEGVIASEFDELEGRFSAGTCNLNTNLLAFGGLRSAADLADELGEAELAATYRARAQALGEAVERFFGAEVQGFHTYRYHDGLDTLRAWICIPLAMGLRTRSEGTLKALFSPKLWTSEGLLTAQDSTTFWDRATLYALRGAFNAGTTDLALDHLRLLTHKRLLGEHVPYAVEAYPEGEGRHLSAESALYARVVTEGLFGFTPTGFRRFTLSPRLPKTWPRMSLRRVRAFGQTFDVEVSRAGAGQSRVVVRQGRQVHVRRLLGEGGTLTLCLPIHPEQP
ncbi:MAG: hypothetical protein HY014_11070 [Acidobacteria bacterium]|nr:hypothetical protein [Acidobacteriota bacterium]MBI3488695.1 hypothetical protein [Acidobacteriota bacterium]